MILPSSPRLAAPSELSCGRAGSDAQALPWLRWIEMKAGRQLDGGESSERVSRHQPPLDQPEPSAFHHAASPTFASVLRRDRPTGTGRASERVVAHQFKKRSRSTSTRVPERTKQSSGTRVL